MARWPGSRSAMRNDRLADRAAKPPHEDLHGHRARRDPDPSASAQDTDRAVRTRPADAPRWDRLQLPGVGRRHGLRRSGQGRPGLGHGRQRVHRPADGLRPGHPRARRRPGRRSRQRADAPGHQLLAHLGGRGPGDGAPQGADRLGRQGPDDGLRHGSHDARDAHRAGLHRPRQDREVRRPVPRRPRLRPDQRLAGRHVRAGRPRRPGPAGLGPRHPGRRRGHDHPGPLQQHRGPAPPVRGPRRGDRGDHRRAGPRQRPGDHAQARVPPGHARPDRGVRDPADLRRGQDRVPLRQGRRGRVLRRSPRTSRPTPRRWATAIPPRPSVAARTS